MPEMSLARSTFAASKPKLPLEEAHFCAQPATGKHAAGPAGTFMNFVTNHDFRPRREKGSMARANCQDLQSKGLFWDELQRARACHVNQQVGIFPGKVQQKSERLGKKATE